MKVLVVDWIEYHTDEMISFFEGKGCQVVVFQDLPRNYHYDPVIRRKILSLFKEGITHVFSVQFFPLLSNLCEKNKIIYFSWCFNAPINELLLTQSIYHTCNRICHTDSFWVEKLQKRGILNVYYLPPAVSEIEDEEHKIPEEWENQKKDLQIFVSDETERWKRYLFLLTKLEEREKGFFNGIIHAQKCIYGFNFLENILSEENLIKIEEMDLVRMSNESIASREERETFQILYPAVTKLETDKILDELKKNLTCPYEVYSDKILDVSAESVLDRAFWKRERGKSLQKFAKINVLVTPREIQNGIPVQAMELLATEGLLITNFQNDLVNFFEPEKELIIYESEEDALEKIAYYLMHEDERKDIVSNVHKKLALAHTIKHRLQDLIDIMEMS